MNKIAISLTIGTALAVMACAAQPQRNRTELFRDLADPKRQHAELDRDRAQCQYELAMASYSRPYTPPMQGYYGDPNVSAGVANLARAANSQGPGVGTYNLCMRAKNWEFVGYE